LLSTAKPEDFIPQLVKPGVETTVVFAAETCSEERGVEDALLSRLDQLNWSFVRLNQVALLSTYPSILSQQESPFFKSFSAFKKSLSSLDLIQEPDSIEIELPQLQIDYSSDDSQVQEYSS